MDKNRGLSSPEGISLKEYVNDKFDNLEKAIDARFESVTQATNSALLSADKAISKSDVALEKRLDSVNEFRATLQDQASRFLNRTEFRLVADRLEQDIKNLQLARATLEGKASQESVNQVSNRAQLGVLFGTIGTILAVLNFIFKFI